MAKIPAPYWYQIAPMVGNYEQVAKGEYALRKMSAGTFEVWQAMSLDLSRPKKQKGTTFWYKASPQDPKWVIVPGQVLRLIWRDANPAEVDWWSNQPKDQWPEGFKRIGNKLRICIVEKYDDLPSPIRQVMRHVINTIVVQTTVFRGKKFITLGTFEQSEKLLQKLVDLQSKLVNAPKNQFQNIRQAVLEELAKIELSLELKRRPDKVAAKKALGIAQRQPQKVVAKIAQAQEQIAKWQEKDREIVKSYLELASKLLAAWRKIQFGIKSRYHKLIVLRGQMAPFILDVTGKSIMTPAELQRIAKTLITIHRDLVKIGPIEPFYKRVHSDEVARLSKAQEHLFTKNPQQTIYNDINLALSKLEALIVGEYPARGEISRIRRRVRSKLNPNS